MGLSYGSLRLTADIDLSLSTMPTEATPQEFRDTLDSRFDFIALEQGLPDIKMRVHSIKKLPRKKFDEASFPGLQLKLNFVDKRNVGQLAAFEKGTSIEILDMDVSFNEPVEDISILRLSKEREILTYGLAELLAEKYRALHQQVIRKRNRRQDVYDIWWLSQNEEMNIECLSLTLARLKDKSISRGVRVSADSILNPEIKERAQAEWETQRLELGDNLPEFDLCWYKVVNLYTQLPWDKN